MNIQRTVTVRLLQLIMEMTSKLQELEAIGVKLDATGELIEKVAATMFEVNGIHPEEAGDLYLLLEDYLSGDIEAHDFMGLLHGAAVIR